jgi:hypothetical protein
MEPPLARPGKLPVWSKVKIQNKFSIFLIVCRNIRYIILVRTIRFLCYKPGRLHVGLLIRVLFVSYELHSIIVQFSLIVCSDRGSLEVCRSKCLAGLTTIKWSLGATIPSATSVQIPIIVSEIVTIFLNF